MQECHSTRFHRNRPLSVFSIGDEVHITVTGVTNRRHYKGAGKVLSINGDSARVSYHHPWVGHRQTLVDLTKCKKINRRITNHG
jgi:ribosomal protein L21E